VVVVDNHRLVKGATTTQQPNNPFVTVQKNKNKMEGGEDEKTKQTRKRQTGPSF
jgi:hypothetical protein